MTALRTPTIVTHHPLARMEAELIDDTASPFPTARYRWVCPACGAQGDWHRWPGRGQAEAEMAYHHCPVQRRHCICRCHAPVVLTPVWPDSDYCTRCAPQEHRDEYAAGMAELIACIRAQQAALACIAEDAPYEPQGSPDRYCEVCGQRGAIGPWCLRCEREEQAAEERW